MNKEPVVEQKRRRTVARRVLYSFAIVMLGFALVAGWSVVAQRTAAREADLMRSGYLPLSLALHDVVAGQDNWNAQLNHLTTARNPADKRMWFESALRIIRPKKYSEVRARISTAFIGTGQEAIDSVGRDLLSETLAIEQFQEADREDIRKIFEALERGDAERAERLRDRLVTRGSQAKRRLQLLDQRVQRNVDALLKAARDREQLALRLLVALAVFTALVGSGMALYAQRVLQPLNAVTERAKAVAEGDLTPRPVVASDDEIGELAATFEGMVSAIARANEQLLAAERLATIGKMAAHVTHEIRNPLSSMGLNVDLLEEELADADDEAKSLLRAIKQEIERLTNLSAQYLSVARRRPSTLEEEHLGDVVREAVEFVRRDLERHQVEVRVEVGDGIPRAMIDVAQIKQALFNLLRNAREAMPGGGAIRVSVQGAAGGGTDLVVDDEGTGIEPEVRERLFEPFFTTKGKGTGLGLAITRQIIEAHGGTIAAEPRDPQGTRFWIHLPELSAAAQPGDAVAADDAMA
jgi:two-component system NtrC family sensor kinase